MTGRVLSHIWRQTMTVEAIEALQTIDSERKTETMEETRQICPLLKHAEHYKPDTVDLRNDPTERHYWLHCLENMVRKFVMKAAALNPDNARATENAEFCYQKFHALVEQTVSDPQQLIVNQLSVRTLLEYNEENLRQHSFDDAWHQQKRNESDAALQQFAARCQLLDGISDVRQRWVEIVVGVLAGNVFDWGSTSVATILEGDESFGLTQAIAIIEKRPWFQDDLDTWINRLQVKPYTRAVVFADNAGVDFVLGVLPLTRELLRSGTKVVLAGNSAPALNDVTFAEMKRYTAEAANHCDILRTALQTGQLLTAPNGQKGPCLDLANLPAELCNLMDATDLIVLEGMGRAVHTNYYAEFNVDCVKMAVLKNEWLANSLGAKQFSVIFDYKSPNI